MKTTIIALATLAALSTGALAQRNFDVSSPPVGETAVARTSGAYVGTNALAASGFIFDSAAGNSMKSGGNSGGGNR